MYTIYCIHSPYHFKDEKYERIVYKRAIYYLRIYVYSLDELGIL